jgi:hypothetical protein
MCSNKCVYMDTKFDSDQIRLGIAELNGCDYTSPRMLAYSLFIVNTESQREKLLERIVDLVEATGLPFLTPRGLLDLEQTKEYLGFS